jgi:hypothetical protein
MLPSKVSGQALFQVVTSLRKLLRFQSVDNLPFDAPFRIDWAAPEARFFTQ